MADEEIVTRFTVEADKAIIEARKFRAEVDAMKAKLMDLAKQSKMSFDDLAKGMRSAFATGGGELGKLPDRSEVVGFNKTMAVALREVKSETKSTTTATNEYAKSVTNLGTVGRFVFGSILGLSVISVLRNITNWLKQAAQAGQEFLKSVYQLAIGVRALQRSGIEITLNDVYENMAKLRKEFGIFSQKELVEGSAALFNLVRDFGFAKEEIFSLQRSISTLAVVNGRAMDDVQRTVALAISSGYTEGLQRLGVSINRVTIAMEAQRLGFGRNYMSLTEQQRALATYNLILEKTLKYEDDLLTFQQTAPGAITKLSAAWTDFTTKFGENFTRATSGFAYLLSALIDGANILDENFGKYNAFAQVIQTIGDEAAKTTNWLLLMGEALAGRISFKDVSIKMKEFAKNWEEGLGDVDTDETEIAMDKIADAIEGKYDEILQIQDDFANRSEDIELDLQRDLEKIDRDGINRRAELFRDFKNKINDISREESQDIADAWTKYYFDLEGIAEDFNDKVADANQDYRENEIKAETDFQEKLRRLREDFLMDLEEALRVRDARQVLRLTKQYNLDKDRIEREADIEADQRKRKHEIELQDIADQRKRKEEELKKELEFRLEQIRLNAVRERVEATIKYQRELIELSNNLKQQREERMLRAVQMQADLEVDFAKRLQTIVNSLVTELGAYAAYDAQIRQMILATFGPGGFSDQILKYYASSRAAYLSGQAAASDDYYQRYQYTNPVPKKASGGTMFATKPTLVQFGEVPEVATFTPLSRLGSGNSQVSLGGKEKVKIELYLSPDLEARVIDKSLGEFADVIMRRLR